MAAMCPMSGCKTKRGMCVHDKLMLVMAGVLAIALGGHWGLHLF
jgi:hypothetical protein